MGNLITNECPVGRNQFTFCFLSLRFEFICLRCCKLVFFPIPTSTIFRSQKERGNKKNVRTIALGKVSYFSFPAVLELFVPPYISELRAPMYIRTSAEQNSYFHDLRSLERFPPTVFQGSTLNFKVPPESRGKMDRGVY